MEASLRGNLVMDFGHYRGTCATLGYGIPFIKGNNYVTAKAIIEMC